MIVQIYEISSVDEALAVSALGVDHLGTVVAEGVERRPGWVDLRTAKEIVRATGKRAVNVLIVISTDLDEIVRIATEVQPGILHLSMHPENFPVEQVRALRQRLPGQKLMQAVPVGGPETRRAALETARAFAPHVDYLIIDTKDVEAVGATGLQNDWSIGREIVVRVDVPVILAGGLSPENVAQAIRAVRPWGVDSMTHTNKPGGGAEKDPARVREFVAAARSASRKL